MTATLVDRRILPTGRDRRADNAPMSPLDFGTSVIARSPGRRAGDVIVIPEYVVKPAIPPVAAFVEDGPLVMASGQRIR